MRDPDRIPIFLKELEKLWLCDFDLRFGQLYFALLGRLSNKGISEDGFYVEDDKWLEVIRDAQKYIDENKQQ